MSSRGRLGPARLALLAALALVAGLAPASTARAGGFYLLDRGARPLGRGGAFVAGADDPGALWYNPAGLRLAGEQLLVDATLTLFDVSFTRIDSGGNTQPTVHGTNAPIPIPTIAASFDLGLPELTFGVGVFAPNAALMQYPEQLVVDGQPYPAPQRYSLLSMDGSAIATVAAGGAWTPIPELSIGLGVHVVLGAFAARVAMSACDGAICTFPEDPDYDGVAQLTLAPIVTASGTFGVTWTPGPVRIGASLMTPFPLQGGAAIQVRPPGAAAFDGAIVRSRGGDCAGVSDDEVAADADHRCRDTVADVNLDFPVVVRFGVELLAVENLRLELAVVWETWSMQRELSVRPRDVWIVDALGFLDYEVGDISIPRNMNDTVSVRLGGEYTIDGTYQIRLGGSYENGAFSDAYLSPLTLDSDKVVVSAGFSLRIDGGLWGDLMVGYAHLFPRQVRGSQVPQANPIRPPVPGGTPVYVGNGDYSFTAPFFGLGIRWQADWQPAPPAAAGVEEPADESAGSEAVDPAGAGGDDAAPLDPTRPWYQQGGSASSGAQAAPQGDATAPTPADAGASEEATGEPRDDEPPARRGRRGRRGRRR